MFEEIIKEYEKKLKKLDEILKDSELTEEDALEIGGKIKKGIARRHGVR